jgi:asparagine synthase (glutamine-hydrolysing)
VVIALTFAPGFASDESRRLVDRSRSALHRFMDRAPEMSSELDDAVVLASGVDAADLLDTDTGRIAILLSRSSHTGDGRMLDGRAVFDEVAAGDDRLGSLRPVFGVCVRSRLGEPIVVATDIRRSRPLYWHQGSGWAAAASSSLVLADVAQAPLDDEGLGSFSVSGYCVADRTPYRGIRVLDPAQLCRLRSGRAELATYWTPPVEPEPLSWEDAVERGVDAFRRSVDACLSAYPGAATELSGGMDSRGMLAAVPADARAGMIAITLAPTSSPDHRVAAQIASRWGMEHQTVDTDRLEQLSGEEAEALVRRAARRRDFTGNPFVFGLTDWAEAQVDQRPRLSGVRGEAARGVYYPGQPRRASTNDKLVESFLRWRVMVNDVIDPTLLTPEFVHDAKATEIRVMKDVFKGFGESWLEATDRYGWFRAQRWQGLNYNAACLDRGILMPFGSPDFLENWAWRTRPADRRHSRLFGHVMTRLDPELAAMPLDTGLVPERLGRGGAQAELSVGWRLARSTTRKVRQRLARRARPAVITRGLAGRVLEHWKTLDEPLAALARLDFLDYEAIRQVTAGERDLDAVSAGFLISLDGMLDFFETQPADTR